MSGGKSKVLRAARPIRGPFYATSVFDPTKTLYQLVVSVAYYTDTSLQRRVSNGKKGGRRSM